MATTLDSDDSRKLNATEIQQQFYKYFGYKREIIWDCYGRDLKDALHRKIDLIFSFVSTQQTAPDNINEKNNFINNVNKCFNGKDHEINKGVIVEAIWSQKIFNNGILLMAPIFVVCIAQSLKHEKDEALLYSIHPVFRVRKCFNIEENNSRNCCMIFIDENGRVYQNWKLYVKHNNLPDSYIVAPKNGIYNSDYYDNVILEKFWSPAHKIMSKILKTTDTTVSIASVGSTVAAVAAVTILPQILVGAIAVSVGCAAFSVARNIQHLVDRSKHGQTIDCWKDKDALNTWTSIFINTAGIGYGTRNLIPKAAVASVVTKTINKLAVNKLSTAVIAGPVGVALGNGLGNYINHKQILNNKDPDVANDVTNLISTVVHLLNKTTMIVNSDGVVNGFVKFLYNNQWDDKTIASSFDKQQLEASVFLFTHSLYNANIANVVMNREKISDLKKFLILYHRININKYIKTKLYIHNDKTNTGFGDNVDTLDIIRTMKTVRDQDIYIKNIYKQDTADNSVVKNDNILNIITSSITLNNNFHILSELNLKASLKIYSSCLSTESFKIFLKMVEDFVRLYGNDIQFMCKRILPFEKFLDDCFQILFAISDCIISKLNALMLCIRNPNLRSKYNMIITNYYTEYYGIYYNTAKKCSLCCGYYNV